LKDSPYTEKIVELVEGFMKENGLNYTKVSASLMRNGKPMSRQGFFKMVKNGSLRVATLMEVLDAHGMCIQIVKKKE